MDSLVAELIIFMFLMLLSGFFAAAEIAIASFGKNKIDELIEKDDPLVNSFKQIQKDPETFFGTIQIITSLALLASSILGYHIALRTIKVFLDKSGSAFLADNAYIITIFFTLIVVAGFAIIISILIPKALGFRYAEFTGKLAVRGLIVLTYVFRYPVAAIVSISNFILRPFGEKTNFSQTRFSEDEIRLIISEGLKSGAIDQTEHEIISNIFEFNDLKAKEVMIPRTEMNAVEINEDPQQNITEIIKSGHTIVPAYDESPDNIIGVIHTKDIMRSVIGKEQPDLKMLIRPGYFVPESKLISEILKEMQKRGERLAIVTDEYGGTEGVITMEDILEEIVGELRFDSTDEHTEYNKLPDGKYYVLGSMTIEDFNDTFNIELPESEEYNTIAGFIADNSGKILNVGELVSVDNVNFELIKKIRQKMVQFRVYSPDGSFAEKPSEEADNQAEL